MQALLCTLLLSLEICVIRNLRRSCPFHVQTLCWCPGRSGAEKGGVVLSCFHDETAGLTELIALCSEATCF